jgi:hypothetical protein
MVASRFVLGDKLGEGGMAEVFHGTVVGAEGFQKPVAIKRISPGFAANARFASMFVDEANIISALDHPNVVQVLAFERNPDKSLFLVMEYVDGVDLSTLSTSGRIPPSIAIMICIRVCRALAYAHARGVIHRDVSPQNVLISWLAAVKLSDFGLAKILKESGDELSQVIKGKPAYMSPEQANGEALDGRTDQWAVGVMLWELLTGVRLFEGDGVKETLAQVFFREILPPRTVKSAGPIGKDVDAVVMRMLQRDRNLRYATDDEVVAALSQCAEAKAIADPEREMTKFLERRFPARVRAARRSGAGQAPRAAMQMTVAGAPSTLASAASQSLTNPTRRGARGALVVAASLVVVGAAGAIGFVLTNARHHEAAQLAEPVGSDVLDAHTANGTVAIAVVHDAPVQITAAHEAALRDADTADPVQITAAAPGAGASSTPTKIEKPATRPIEPAHHAPPQVIAHAAADHATAQGFLTVLIDPWADVYVDSKRIHSTPLQRLPLAAGVHQVKLMNSASGKQEQKSVTISADKETTIDEIW